MEIRQLHYFLAVCEEMHFTKAAENIGVTQPTLSQQIRALEDELGMPLFDRIGKRILLTEAGELLLSYSNKIFDNIQYVKDSIADLRQMQRGTIRLGIFPSDLDYRITQLLIDFYERFPAIKLKVIASIDIPQQVLDSEVDIGIGTKVQPHDSLVSIPVCQEEYVLIVSRKHALADRQSVRIQEMKDLPMVIYPEGFTGRNLVEETTRRYGFKLHSIMETSSVTSIINLVRANIGATIQPYPLMRLINDPELRIIRFEDESPLRKLELIYRSDRYLSQAAKVLIGNIQEYFRA